jgi:cytochrome c oxidase assembly protein subunit 15
VKASDHLLLFRRLARVAALLAFIVVIVGAWVRLTNAGLGCPDWPGCYGHLHPAQALERIDEINANHPDRQFDYQKALNEMVHRYIASTLGLLVIALNVLAWLNRRDPEQPRVTPPVLLVLILAQGALGAFTVTLLLKPPIVTLHLLGGLATLSLLWWLSLRPDRRELKAAERPLRRLALAGAAVLVVQLLLGGWTSTNYAAVACPDFPTCHQSYWPTMDAREGFVLWRGLGVDYEGGVLDQPARVAIHYTHRIGAVVTAGVLLWLGVLGWRRAQSSATRFASAALIAALLLQWLIGANLVLRGFPLWLGTAHNAGAALLTLSLVTLLRSLWPRSGLR